jgi:hypothetical protein
MPKTVNAPHRINVGVGPSPQDNERRQELAAKEHRTPDEQAELDLLLARAGGYFHTLEPGVNRDVPDEIATHPLVSDYILTDEQAAAVESAEKDLIVAQEALAAAQQKYNDALAGTREDPAVRERREQESARARGGIGPGPTDQSPRELPEGFGQTPHPLAQPAGAAQPDQQPAGPQSPAMPHQQQPQSERANAQRVAAERETAQREANRHRTPAEHPRGRARTKD